MIAPTLGNLIFVNYMGIDDDSAPLQEFTRSPDVTTPVQTIIADLSAVNPPGSVVGSQDLQPAYVSQLANGHLLVTGYGFTDVVEIADDGTLSIYLPASDLSGLSFQIWDMRVDDSGRLCIASGGSGALVVSRWNPDKSFDTSWTSTNFNSHAGHTSPCLSPDGESVAYCTTDGAATSFWKNDTLIFTGTTGDITGGLNYLSAAVGFASNNDVICVWGQGDTLTTPPGGPFSQRWQTFMQRFGTSPGGPYTLADETTIAFTSPTPVYEGVVRNDSFSGGDNGWVARYTNELIGIGDPDPCSEGQTHDLDLCELDLSSGSTSGTFTLETPCGIEWPMFPWVVRAPLTAPVFPGLARYDKTGMLLWRVTSF